MIDACFVVVVPANAGTQCLCDAKSLDSRIRGNDTKGYR
jgi:hypothetical protein